MIQKSEQEPTHNTIYNINHFVWITKYKKKIITDKIASRLKVLLMQGCSTRKRVIIKGKIMLNHVHLLISVSPALSVSQIMQYLKERSSKKL